YCDLHEQRLVKIHAKGKGILGRRPTGKTVNPNKPKPVSTGNLKPVSAGQQNTVSAGPPNPVYAIDGLLGPRPLNIQPMSTYLHSFTHNNQQIIFPITHNSLYSLYMTSGLNGKTTVKPSASWPWTKYAMIEAIRLFLAFDVFIGFKVYQMDVKSAFFYGKIAEEVYVTQPKGFEDPGHLKKVYKVVKAFNGLHQAPRAWYERLSTFLLKHSEFEMSSMGPLTFFLRLQVDQRSDGIFIHQTKSMIGCLIYFISTRLDTMFAVCAAARHQVTPKTSNLLSVKRIFKYLTAYPKLGLWYPRDSPFDLEAFSDSDYADAYGDRKSTTGRCQFLGRRLISWQCKKQTIVATSSCEAEYVAAASCCGQPNLL
nr:hypothetical protein [Tanacetum cinerariifolium]